MELSAQLHPGYLMADILEFKKKEQYHYCIECPCGNGTFYLTIEYEIVCSECSSVINLEDIFK